LNYHVLSILKLVTGTSVIEMPLVERSRPTWVGALGVLRSLPTGATVWVGLALEMSLVLILGRKNKDA
jgi:hypothetical protein